MGDFTNIGSIGVISCLQMHPQGMCSFFKTYSTNISTLDPMWFSLAFKSCKLLLLTRVFYQKYHTNLDTFCLHYLFEAVHFCFQFVYSALNPGQAAAAAAPIAVFLGVTGISFAAFPLSKIFPLAFAQAIACGAVGAFLVHKVIQKQLGHLLVKSSSTQPEPKDTITQNKNLGFLSDIAGPKGTQLEIVYGVFGYMQVLSACFMSFAHGGNDVSNAIGPLAAALSILHGGSSGTNIVIPLDVLAWGGFGIVAGLMMWGYRVIATIGKKITELTPTRGFAAEFAAASVVLFASKLCLPISATHTLVGAVMGVGFARGLNSVRSETVKEIVLSWAVTIPVGATFAVIYTWILTKLISYIL